MKNIVLSMFAFGIFLSSCKQPAKKPVAKLLNTVGISAVGPYLTKDRQGNAVLCWTEQDGLDSLNRLKYAVYNPKLAQFGIPITVSVSAGCSTTAESMGKIAFKSDGTVLAIFARKFPKEKNPYAGAIFYTMSANGGKTWSNASFLHSDTVHTYGRSFFDVTRTREGEIAAVWLDGRFGRTIKGSALYFCRTSKGEGFGRDTCLQKGTCECCRTDILTDEAGNIHLAYRSIIFPSALSGRQVRDMVYQLSADNGKSFSAPKVISKDNWEIEGCPHSGPSLSVTKNTTDAIWFTAGGNSGLYFTSALTPGVDFRTRNLITATGRHPQMIRLNDEKLAMVCEEIPETVPSTHAMVMDHSKGMMNHGPAAEAKIVLRVLSNGTVEKVINLSDGRQSDHHAVLARTEQGLLTAWIRERNGVSRIFYTTIDPLD
jgi:hypothetical protein